MKNRKTIIAIGCTAAIVILLVAFFILRGGSTSVVGEWKIDHYITDDGEIKQDDIGKYYGENYQTANSAFAVGFEKGGKATLYLPTYEGTETVSRECNYEVDGDYIYLSANGDRNRAFEIKGDTLIVYGVSGFDGNAILKKQ